MRSELQDPNYLKDIIEALVFASDEPLSPGDIRSLILDEPVKRAAAPAEGSDEAEAQPEPLAEEGAEQPATGKRAKKNPLEFTTIRESVELLNASYEETGRAFRIVEIAGGFQFATLPTLSMYVARLYKERSRRRLSSAALETLAIIAYKQPVSKADVENIRGVNCDEVLKSLLEKNLVTITGRAESVGRPLLYGTTDEFLRQFGLASMRDLPKPREIEELLKEEAVKATTLEEAANEFVDPDAEQEAVTIDEIIAVSKEENAQELRDEELRNEELRNAEDEDGSQAEAGIQEAGDHEPRDEEGLAGSEVSSREAAPVEEA